MTVDGREGNEGVGAGPFDGIDPKLTIYALANGMDLNKNGGVRRLEWYRDGHERGILLTADSAGAISIVAQAWKRGDETSLRRTPIAEHLGTEELGRSLSSHLERGLEAANAL